MLKFNEWKAKYSEELSDAWNTLRGEFESESAMLNFLYNEYLESGCE
jgi:hypothetical protein